MELDKKILNIKIDKKRIFTESQVNELSKITINNKPILTPYTAFELVEAVKEYGFDEIYKYLQTYSQKYKSIEELIINLPSMKAEKKKLIDEINNFGNTQRAKSGYRCNSCGSEKTFAIQKQVRSSDEPATLFVRCSTCQKSWRIG